jgi:hypothetical protein
VVTNLRCRSSTKFPSEPRRARRNEGSAPTLQCSSSRAVVGPPPKRHCLGIDLGEALIASHVIEMRLSNIRINMIVMTILIYPPISL